MRARVTASPEVMAPPGTAGDEDACGAASSGSGNWIASDRRELAASKGDADDPPSQDASIDRAELAESWRNRGRGSRKSSGRRA